MGEGREGGRSQWVRGGSGRRVWVMGGSRRRMWKGEGGSGRRVWVREGREWEEGVGGRSLVNVSGEGRENMMYCVCVKVYVSCL